MRLEAPSTLYNDETDRTQRVNAARYFSFIFHNPKVRIHSAVNTEGPLAQALQDRNGFYVRL